MVVIPRQFDPPLPVTAPRALLVGPHPLVVTSIAHLLAGPPLRMAVETVARSDEAVDRVASDRHELLLCEYRSAPISGLELPALLEERDLATRVMLLVDEEDSGQVLSGLDCGAAGFFSNGTSADEFIEGVKAVLAGHCVIGRSLAQAALNRLSGRQPASSGPYDRLSPAERGVLELMEQAQTTRAIAAARGISDKTVRNHMASIYRKLEVRNRSEAIMWSLRMQRAERRAG